MIAKGIRLIGVAVFLCITSVVLGQEEFSDMQIDYITVDQTLKEIFKDLEKKYDIRFSYSTESILEKRKTCDFEDIELTAVLDYLLGDEDLEYKRVGNNILLRKDNRFIETQNDRYQKSIHLKGRVVFEDNHEDLVYASVSIKNSSIGTFTNEQGAFDLEIPSQYFSDSLIVHYLGLEDQVFLIKDLEEEFILVPLSLGNIAVDEVVIVNRRKKIRILDTNNAISIQLRDNPQSGILGADLSRNLQKQAGVSASDDSSAEIKIRGSHSDETLVILDDMPVYNCSHYYGIFNSINTNYVDEIQLYKSFFPFEYGGKTGGIVELHSSDDIKENDYLDWELDLMTIATKARLALSDNTNLTIAGRSTLRNISNTQFNSFANNAESEIVSVQSFNDPVNNNRSNPSFKFYDLNAKLHWDLSDNQSFTINGFNSNDTYDNTFKRTIKENNSNNELKLESVEKEEWENRCSSIKYNSTFKHKWQLTTIGYFSNYESKGEVRYEINKPPKNQNEPPEPKISIGLEHENRIRDIGVNTFLKVPLASHTLKVGVEMINHDIFYELVENQNRKLKGINNANDISIYGTLNIVPFENLSINGGLRSTYFQETDGYYHSPRVLLNYKVGESFKLKTSFGSYQQFIREFPFEYRGTLRKLWVTAGKNGIPVLESKNWMVGMSKVFNNLGVDVELYYKDFEGLTEFAILQPGQGNEETSPGQRDYNLFKGNGFSRGMDVMLNSGYKNYDTYLSYTLSESKERYKGIAMNQFFSSEDDRRHQVKWTNVMKWNQFRLGLDYIYLSGKRYTDLGNLGSEGNITTANPNNRFRRLNPYSRFDISMGYDFRLLKHSSRISFSVLNVFNSANQKYVQNVSEDINQSSEPINVIVGNESALLERTFNISWRMEFGKR